MAELVQQSFDIMDFPFLTDLPAERIGKFAHYSCLGHVLDNDGSWESRFIHGQLAPGDLMEAMSQDQIDVRKDDYITIFRLNGMQLDEVALVKEYFELHRKDRLLWLGTVR